MAKDIGDKIQHIVVLMLENRSFDHVMGDLPGVNGIRNAHYNLLNPYAQESSSNPAFNPYPIDVNNQPLEDFDPDHSFHGMMMDLFGPATYGYVSSPVHGPIPPAPSCQPTQTNCGFLHGFGITGATNSLPIFVSTLEQGPDTGDKVAVANVAGNTAANSTPDNPWVAVSTTDSGVFALGGSDGNNSGSYVTGSGTWSYLTPPYGITGATSGHPIGITTPGPSPSTWSQVVVAGVAGNTAANNTPANPTWTVTHTGSRSFSLNELTGSENYVPGSGSWCPVKPKMSYFRCIPAGPTPAGALQVLHGLAKNYCLCDNWFCDVPAYTIPNRMFMHAATSRGYLDSAVPVATTDPDFYYNAKSIYSQLTDHGRDWAVYYYAPYGQCDSMWFADVANQSRAQLPIQCFASDVAAGRLPFYTFLMPALGGYGPNPAVNGNSMHPDADVRWGENYVAHVYNTLRNSEYWDKLLFIVTFDENGGIYDHVLPPNTVPPDGFVYRPGGQGTPVLFDFSLLGPRVPAILISPWIDAQIDRRQYQNTSILRFVQDLVGAPREVYLTERDRHANSFADRFTRAAPRTDCPTEMVGYEGFDWPMMPPVGAITSASNDSPIVITSDAPAPPSGTQVVVSGVLGNTAANNTPDNPQWTVTQLTTWTFSLTDSHGSGTYTISGTWTWPNPAAWLGLPPGPLTVQMASQYAEVLPGHPDSGKPVTRTFSTQGELLGYAEERKQAALRFYAKGPRAPEKGRR